MVVSPPGPDRGEPRRPVGPYYGVVVGGGMGDYVVVYGGGVGGVGPFSFRDENLFRIPVMSPCLVVTPVGVSTTKDYF